MKQNTAWVSENEKAHGANWRKWLGHLKGTPARGVEVGTWLGESAEWMLDNIFTHIDSTYDCVDTFEGSEEHRFAGIDCSTIYEDASSRLARFFPRVTLHKEYSAHYLRRAPSNDYDFVYIDAAHDALNVLRDSVLAFEILKVGGVMIFDDYTWNVFPDAIDCPKMAVDAFMGCFAKQVEVIGVGYQVAIRRVA